jgi:DNA-binding transcriptional LysR family regulator
MHHLRIFHMVAICESYSRAAERLNITQPAVSMQVAKLEEAVGVTLVKQRGRHVALTEAGQSLSDYASRLFRIADEAVQAMNDFKELRKGRLRVGASTTPGAYLLPRVIADFQAKYHGVSINLNITNSLAVLQALVDGAFDLAIIGEPPPDIDVELRPLCSDCLTVVVAPTHRWAAAGKVTAEELSQEPLILREAGSSTRDVLNRRMAAIGLQPKVGLELGSTDAVREAVAAGLGPSVLSGWAVRWSVESGKMVQVRLTGLSLERTIHLALGRGVVPSTLAMAFIAQLEQSDLSGSCM